MDDQAKRTLRLDRRLLERRGWIADADLERELSALPDVSDKIDPRDDSPSGEESSEGSPLAPNPAGAEPTGSFSTQIPARDDSSNNSGNPGGGFNSTT